MFPVTMGARAVSRPAPAPRVGETARYLNLVRELALSNFKLKYTGSVLGYLWSLFKPLMYFGVLYVIFVEFFHQRQPDFPLQLFVAIVLFTFFSECTATALGSIAGNAHLIRKANFPLSALVVANSVTALLTLAINLSLLVVVATPFGRLHLGLQSLAAPLLLVELYLFSLGVGMILASAYVFYRDLGHVWEVFLQVLLYGCGVVFPISVVPERFLRFFFLNPLAQIIEDFRHALVTQTGAPWTFHLVGPIFFVPLVFTVAVFVAGLLLFRRLAPLFAESL
ncbi:MAG: LPS ABC transporter [Candidatus Nephthysia bennettiae]|nr:MAG: LPS ABC transporter [Candidatus Dormibacteraeota bacterium]